MGSIIYKRIGLLCVKLSVSPIKNWTGKHAETNNQPFSWRSKSKDSADDENASNRIVHGYMQPTRATLTGKNKTLLLNVIKFRYCFIAYHNFSLLHY